MPALESSTLHHLECTGCGANHDADRLHNLCPACGKVLFARYDLERARATLTRESVARRPRGMWRWREILPVRDPEYIVTLGEGDTPLLPALRLGKRLGLTRLWFKEESLCPTGSFKARGLSAAVSRNRELGATAFAVPSAGNAASALAAYAARAGVPAHVFMPVDTPELFQKEDIIYGASATLVRGLINDCGAIVKARAPAAGWFDVSTLKEPYRAEGKKTMGLELAEQFGWELPDAVVYPTGGGTGIVGMWKAWAELEAMGLIGRKRPKMISVQAEGCAPIVRAFQEGRESAGLWQGASTSASGLRVPVAVADSLILRAVRESGGTAVTVTDDEMVAGMHAIGASEGIFAAPEGAATWVATEALVERGFLKRDDSIVLFNTGTGLKYANLVEARLPTIDPEPKKP